jgi:hypothetical protein
MAEMIARFDVSSRFVLFQIEYLRSKLSKEVRESPYSLLSDEKMGGRGAVPSVEVRL